MGGRFVRWSKIASVDRYRNCPLCGRDIEVQTYPEEVAVRFLSIVAVVGAGYWAKQRGGGYLTILLTVTAVLVILYLGASYRLRNEQRFKKGRNAAGG